MNQFNATGRLTKDIELRQTQNGNTVMQNTIAVRRDFKSANGEYESDFINIVVYGQTAQYLAQYACKGALIEVVGRWQHRSYQDNQGNTKYVDECVVNSASVLQKPQEQQQPQYQGQYQGNQYQAPNNQYKGQQQAPNQFNVNPNYQPYGNQNNTNNNNFEDDLPF